MNRRFFIALAGMMFLLPFQQEAWAGLDKEKTRYEGGTLSLGVGQEGKLETDDPNVLRLTNKKGQLWTLDYASVTRFEYGQHAGRRVGVAIATAALAIFSKKRRHYLTIHFVDESQKSQVAVFQVGKRAIRTLIPTLEARTGKTVQLIDEAARRAGYQ